MKNRCSRGEGLHFVHSVVADKSMFPWFVRANRQQTHHVSGLPRHAKKQGKSSRPALCGEKEAGGQVTRVDEWIGQVLSCVSVSMVTDYVVWIARRGAGRVFRFSL